MELSKVIAAAKEGQSTSRQADALREKLDGALKIVDQMAGATVVRRPDQKLGERDIRTLLKLRRSRSGFFGPDLFADPAWDMLLELYSAELGQFRVSVSNLCAAAGVPATTALRWIGHLEQRGLIVRRPDPMDGRRHFVMLSSEGLETISAYFRTVPAGTPLI